MQRTRLLFGPLVALLLLAAACGGGDDGDSGDAESAEAEATTTTAAPEAPANPEGDFLLLRWIAGTDNPTAISNTGLLTTRLWNLEPTCDDEEPCDLDLTGAGEGGSYDTAEFPPAEEIPEPATLTYDDGAESWVLEEDLGAYGNCRTEDGEYLAGDYTTMDEVDRMELAWDEDGERLVGTKTETYTLNDAGRANPECTEDSDEVVTYEVVAVPLDQLDAEVEEPVELADEYRQTREVYAVEGTELISVYDWRVFDENATGEGECGPDECDASIDTPTSADQEVALDLAYDDGALSASWAGTGSCSTAEAITNQTGEVLTDEGYDSTWDLEVQPVTVNDDGDQVLIAHGDYVSTPQPEAAEAFPDDCARVERTGAYWYFLPTDLVD
jgi:hypothetical protein